MLLITQLVLVVFLHLAFSIMKISNLYLYKRASLACAARLADTLCPPEAPFGRLKVTLVNYKGDIISKYICPTVIIDIARKITKFINF